MDLNDMPKIGLHIMVLACLVYGVSSYIQDDLTIPVDKSIPRIRPLRRQIRHFEPGRTGQITIIYQTSHPDDIRVRWFRKAKGLSNAEIPNHLTIESDPRYRVKHLAVNDVRAVTLKVGEVALWDFPMSFVLVLTAGHPAVEYQLDTKIEEASPFTFDHVLDEIRWVALPVTPTIFSYHGYMSVTCIAVLDSTSDTLDELYMYRVTFEKERFRQKKRITSPVLTRDPDPEIGRIVATGVGQMHEARNNYVEESGTFMTIGSRTKLPMDYFRYELTIRVRNATREEDGAYTCSMERAEDRTFASAWVREGHSHRRPSLQLVACENNVMTKRRRDQAYHYRVVASVGRETCVKCRAYGYPMADLRLSKDGSDVSSDYKHNIDVHVNVADGGLRELTYTFMMPGLADTGNYECHAHHDGHVETLKFKLDVKYPGYTRPSNV